MSTSIELHIEIRIMGHWHHYNKPEVADHYLLFGKMAGVRDKSIEPLSPPKGLPENATFTTRFCFEQYEGQYHSASWLSSEEVTELSKWLELDKRIDFTEDELFGFLFTNRYGKFLEFIGDYPINLDDFRFVFWFDN